VPTRHAQGWAGYDTRNDTVRKSPTVQNWTPLPRGRRTLSEVYPGWAIQTVFVRKTFCLEISSPAFFSGHLKTSGAERDANILDTWALRRQSSMTGFGNACDTEVCASRRKSSAIAHRLCPGTGSTSGERSRKFVPQMGTGCRCCSTMPIPKIRPKGYSGGVVRASLGEVTRSATYPGRNISRPRRFSTVYASDGRETYHRGVGPS
jgi:hypothetical protein